MALIDWVRYSTANATSFLDVSTPVLGAGSLAMISNTTTAADRAVAAHLISGYARGNIKGIMRSLIRIDRTLSSNFTSDGPGFFFMCDNLDPTATSSNFYWVGLRVDNQMDVIIHKGEAEDLSSMNWETNNIADSVVNVSVNVGDIIPFQVEWNADGSNIGGVRIIVSRGPVNDTDFDNLAVDYDLVDAISPHFSTVIEGIGWSSEESTIPVTSGEGFTFDETGMFKLV